MKKLLMVLAFVSLLVLPNLTLADGGIFPYYPYWTQESAQKAVIVQQGNLETMIISMNFDGNATDFSWILPTPSQPQVTKAPYNIVSSIESFVSEHQYRMILPLEPPNAGLGAGAENGVNVIERRTIDIYDISVLKASNQNDLYNWLTTNGYHYPTAGKYVLDDYISNGWYFTAIKVNAESVTVAQDQLRYGTANPIKLVFNSANLVYPLKISGLVVGQAGDLSSVNVSMPINLYVLADQEKQATGFSKDWVGRLEPDVIKGFAHDTNGNPWFSPTKSMVLTALTDYIAPADMREDVFLTNNSNAAPAPIAYDYKFISQSEYPTISNGGGGASVTVTLENTGYEAWYEEGDNPVRLGTSHPNDRDSSFYTENALWESPNRISQGRVVVYPGEQHNFFFKVSSSNLKNGVYREYFTPVVENKMWMKDIGIYWDIKVVSAVYQAQYLAQSDFPTVKKGETANLAVTYKNTGTTTWQTDTSLGYAVRLGTSNPLDRNSIFQDSSWLSSNRVVISDRWGTEPGANVPPGMNGTFNFQIKAPNTPGTYVEYFRPVVDGVQWLDDAGLYWEITVTD